jgi:hypothetical protein
MAETRALVRGRDNLPATLGELQGYVSEKKARFEARRALIRRIADLPGAEEYKDAAIEAAILDIGLGWEATARIGDILGPGEGGAGRGNKTTIGDSSFQDRNYRAFARACQRARDAGVLDEILEKAKSDRQLPRWTAPLGGALVQKMTGEQENYTPGTLLEMIRKVLGNIDLDPASCARAQKTVQANRYFTEKEDGLAQAWAGRVFLNPPYTARIVNLWIKKLIEQLPNIEGAILLTNDNTDTEWFCQAIEACTAVCFVGRIHFHTADGAETQPTNGQAIFYFGKKLKSFAKEFAGLGPVMTVYRGG